MNNKQLDSYSMLIVSKYFKTSDDYITIICVNSKFKETTEKLRFNPIPINSLKLFPKIQTQYLYSYSNTKIEGIDNYEIWYQVNYDFYTQFKNSGIFHSIEYSESDREKYGKNIPNIVTTLGDSCFTYCTSLEVITLPSKLISIDAHCFFNCTSLKSIDLPSSLISLGEMCFYLCNSLQSINLPSTLTSIGDECFSYCSSLTSINLPTTVTSLNSYCFYGCLSLKSINLPSILKSLGDYCFSGCSSLSFIDLPSSLTSLGDYCFEDCLHLEFINGKSKIRIGKKCYKGCKKLKQKPDNLNCTIS
ncbi:hypothetical protein QTN25_008469 [Entamoeba marina]